MLNTILSKPGENPLLLKSAHTGYEAVTWGEDHYDFIGDDGFLYPAVDEVLYHGAAEEEQARLLGEKSTGLTLGDMIRINRAVKLDGESMHSTILRNGTNDLWVVSAKNRESEAVDQEYTLIDLTPWFEDDY